MAKSFQIPPTINGYDMFEATSSLQKAIRRSDEDQALFWAVEFFDSGKAEYVWQRLFVMTSEDIGLANLNLPQQIWSLYQMYSYLKGKSNAPEKLPYIQAILSMVRSPKSRLIDWALIDAFRLHSQRVGKTQAPDYALDKHTRRGKALGRGFKHFFAEGCKLEPHAKQDREDEYMESSRKILVEGNGDGVLFPEE